MHSATHQAISAVWRIESAKIVATVARMVRDIGLAEELAQDALVSALEHWPRDGVPANPAAWLVTAAKRKALDHLRHLKMQGEKLEELGHDLEAELAARTGNQHIARCIQLQTGNSATHATVVMLLPDRRAGGAG